MGWRLLQELQGSPVQLFHATLADINLVWQPGCWTGMQGALDMLLALSAATPDILTKAGDISLPPFPHHFGVLPQ